MPEPTRRTQRRGAIAAVYGVVFVSFVDVFAMLPTVAPYAVSLGGGLVGVGVAVGAYSATNLVFNLVGGALIDVFGRRRVLVGGLGLAAVAVGAYAFVVTLPQFIVVRLLHGVAGGLVVPAVFTVAGDLAPARGRGRVMGRMGAVIGLAAIVAPAAAGILRQAVGFVGVFASVAALTVAGAVLALATVREPGEVMGRHRDEGRLSALVRRRDLQVALVVIAALTFAVGALAAFLPAHAEATADSPAVTGALFTAYAVAATAAMLSRLARSVDVRGPLGPVSSGLTLVALACGALVMAPSLWLTATAASLFGLGYGLVFPAVAGFLAAGTEPAERGRAFGLFNACFSLGIVLGAPASGLFSAATGFSPFLPATAVTAAVAVFVLARRRVLAPPQAEPFAGTRRHAPQ